MESLGIGLQLSLFGLLITFMALGILILVISLLQLLFPSRTNEEESSQQPHEESMAEGDPHERLVALTAAWWYWQQKRSSSLGKQLEKDPGKRWRKKEKA